MKVSENNFNKVYPDENALMDCCSNFNSKVQERVMEKMKEGKTGWANPENKNEYKGKVLNNVEDQFATDFENGTEIIDIAIWAMFLWNMIEEPEEKEEEGK